MIPESIICEKCGERTFPDHEQHPIWGGGIFEYQCKCGWSTNIMVHVDNKQASALTTSTTKNKSEFVHKDEE